MGLLTPVVPKLPREVMGLTRLDGVRQISFFFFFFFFALDAAYMTLKLI